MKASHICSIFLSILSIHATYSHSLDSLYAPPQQTPMYLQKKKPKKKTSPAKTALTIGAVAASGYVAWVYGPDILRACKQALSELASGTAQPKYAYHIGAELSQELQQAKVPSQHLIRYLETGNYPQDDIAKIVSAKPTGYVKYIIQRLAQYGPQFGLPKDLENNTQFDILHFESNQQSGATCGAHALFNAKAIEALIREGKKLTADAIKQKARELYNPDLFKDHGNWISNNAMNNAKQQIQLKNAYFAYQQLPQLYNPRIILGDVDKDIERCAHFIIFTPMFGDDKGHWTLASYVRQPHERGPVLILLDSLNSPISNNNLIHQVVQRIAQ